MVECWIGLTNIPTHGREFSFDDQDMWRMLWREFQYDAEILAPCRPPCPSSPSRKDT